VSKTVRNVFVMGSGGVNSAITLQNNEFMTGATATPLGPAGMNPKAKDTIGPELGIGFALGDAITEPVMTLKSCIGDRALGWDLLPPGTPASNYTDSTNKTWTYAGYHQSPEKWPAGTTPVPMGWAAGIQFDGDTSRAYDVLGNISTFYPGATCYEVRLPPPHAYTCPPTRTTTCSLAPLRSRTRVTTVHGTLVVACLKISSPPSHCPY
jgi:hypothetical protein